MPLPLYFIPAPDSDELEGKIAACGWYSLPDGQVHTPEVAGALDALVFDDRGALPNSWEAVLREAERWQAEVLVLDFERPVCPAAIAFVQALSRRFPTVAPAAFCRESAAIPLSCYRPAEETFAEFLSHLSGWVELRPVEETVVLPLPGAGEAPASPAFFSEALQCCYHAIEEADRRTLHLFDTPETFQHRFARLAPHAQAAIVLREEWARLR